MNGIHFDMADLTSFHGFLGLFMVAADPTKVSSYRYVTQICDIIRLPAPQFNFYWQALH
jgi:hypothetical protein